MSKCANVRYRKKQVLLWFTINSQPKLKRFSISTKKSLLRNLTRFHGGFFESEIPESFTWGFLLKTIIWTWIFDNWHKVKHWKKRKKNEKWEKSNNSSWLLLFYIGKFIFWQKTYLEKLSLYCYICLPFFHVAGGRKCSNINVHINIHWFCRRHTSIQNTWQ